ncbi:hypothetical protein SODALDRAFT_118055 [Sodiomyces alkalinus F11]|uniref:Uncharacterized protein n=1 Tax=Sodiomyces alkalinus (strain CBS 110278 / VKM F-3762 / F11) TaxID=1314773 RepID=A0A3N2Q3P1_SODAK|nr:hypothetical protein SODALDRAFT_118055 [Sodiomyces alkalinus F11]ROT41379.1 hypothetical protein SODALDRAFT_118055 [Sodiomyces alkalinus F11]
MIYLYSVACIYLLMVVWNPSWVKLYVVSPLPPPVACLREPCRWGHARRTWNVRCSGFRPWPRPSGRPTPVRFSFVTREMINMYHIFLRFIFFFVYPLSCFPFFFFFLGFPWLGEGFF